MKLVVTVFTILLALAGHAVSSMGATWHVGLGGFVTIQEAIDAAAPGDTVRIGLGWHSYYTMFEGNRVYARVTKDNLRFIGEGMNATFVGPSTPEHTPGEAPSAFYAKSSWGVERVAFEDLAIANVYAGVRCNGPRLEMARCRLWRSNVGVYASLPDGGTISDCRFEDSPFYDDDGVFLVNPSNGVVIAGCTFQSQGTGIADVGGGTLQIIDSDFQDCHPGVTAQFGTAATVLTCHFTGIFGVFLYLSSGVIDGCVFEEMQWNCLEVDRSSVVGSGNVFGGGGVSTIHLRDAANVELHDNHIFSAGTAYITCEQYLNPPLRVYHLENNYWGTDDVDAIYALIESCPYMQVDIEPLADGPVQTESTTWGAVKSLFR